MQLCVGAEAPVESVRTSTGLELIIRKVEVRDFWGLAEVHCQSFYPRAGWPFAAFLRLDRVVAMQASAHSSIATCRMGAPVSGGAARAAAVLVGCLPEHSQSLSVHACCAEAEQFVIQ